MSIYPTWLSTRTSFVDWLGSTAALDYLVRVFDPLQLSISAADCLLLLYLVSDPLKLAIAINKITPRVTVVDLLQLSVSYNDPLKLNIKLTGS